MNFEEKFDFWIAKKVNKLFQEGYTFEQSKVMMGLVLDDFFTCIDDKNVLQEIKNKIELTLGLFYMKG